MIAEVFSECMMNVHLLADSHSSHFVNAKLDPVNLCEYFMFSTGGFLVGIFVPVL